MRTFSTGALGSILALGLTVTLPSTVEAQAMTPIVRTDIRAATAPNYGCDAWHSGVQGIYYTLTRIPGGSPSGRDSLRFEALPTSDSSVQFQWGCVFQQSLEPTPPQGSIRYVRWRIKVLSPVNWHSIYEDGLKSTGDKMFILGNNCETSAYRPTRVIVADQTHGPAFNDPTLGIAQNVGPGIYDRPIPIDQWASVQFKIRSSSSESVSDGRFDMYVNNNNEGSPTATASGIQIRTVGWGRNTCTDSWMLWGNGSFRAMAPGGSHRLELADFEYDDQFDPNWAIGAASGSSQPSAPSNLRILSSAAPLPFGLLGLVLLWRQKRRD